MTLGVERVKTRGTSSFSHISRVGGPNSHRQLYCEDWKAG